jgi:hypothetical protein
VKRVYRVMKAHGLLLERHTGGGEERRHAGRVAVERSDTRWCSDGFEIGCDNGEKVRIAFTLDCCGSAMSLSEPRRCHTASSNWRRLMRNQISYGGSGTRSRDPDETSLWRDALARGRPGGRRGAFGHLVGVAHYVVFGGSKSGVLRRLRQLIDC